MRFEKYLVNDKAEPCLVTELYLVAFSYHDYHLDVDSYKSDKLPNKASSKEFYKPCWYHGCKVLIIRFYCLFDSLHFIPFL